MAYLKYECVVRSVTTDSLVAVLYDLIDRSQPEMEATFFLEEISPDDRLLVEPGAVFYWTLFVTSVTSQSKIWFRRLPALTASELQDIEREVAEFEELLGDG